MNLIEESFSRIFPDESLPYTSNSKYSGRFSGFNAVVRKRGNHLEFSISKKWKGVDREILIGLIQNLLLKIMKRKGKSTNIDLYHHFIKSLHLSTEKTEVDADLAESFDRVANLMDLFDVEKPNLVWGESTFRKLASYTYESDTVTVSNIFRSAPNELIDYLMYHELLHKKFKFEEKNGRSLHHSPEFKRWEARFPNAKELEKQLSIWSRKKKGFLGRLWWK